MAIRILNCKTIGLGCRITLGLDAPNALPYLNKACAARGWKVEVPKPLSGDSLLTTIVRGPSADEFRTALVGDLEFVFQTRT